MSDIIERLRQMADHDANDYAIGHYWNAVEEAADEIERQAKSIEEAMTQLAWKDDEIERLRGLLIEGSRTMTQTARALWCKRVRAVLDERPNCG